MRSSVRLLLLVLFATPRGATAQEAARWERRAQAVTIVRDDWGIAHVRGHTDADAVFGMVYAQAEDDFDRIETNYLTSLGRLAEADGEAAIWKDLRQRLFVDPDTLRAQYRRSPAWLRALMDAWADGLNYYLHTHPDVHPRVLTRFEPWMALSFSEGSIGGDIEQIDTLQLRLFYASDSTPATPANDDDDAPRDASASNGIAIAPALTVDHHALLLINPHTSFYFRSELQVTSDEGLDAYGAVTWGQFFVYQGFNERVGWMHTSSAVDNIDQYLETVEQRGGRRVYRYGQGSRPVVSSAITLRYRTSSGMAERRITAFRTHHGPIVRRVGDRWVSVRLLQDPVNSLIQSYSRTKARNLAEFRRSLDLHANSSNNTVYADADGHIAYFHADFIPRRDTALDWRSPVEGSNPATEWGPPLSVDESPHVLDPAAGWIYNVNDAPWWAAGPDSPRKADFPAYVDSGGTSPRGWHALRVLEHARGWTLDSLVAAAYDSYLTWFEPTIPALVRAWDSLPATDSLKARVSEQVGVLRGWDLRWAAASVPTTLGVFWGTSLVRRFAREARNARLMLPDYVAARVPGRLLLEELADASDTLTARYGTWRTPWGDVNRFQRLTGSIAQTYDDARPSIPVPFTSATWGSLASFDARARSTTRKVYGNYGNTFVAAVEFGDSVRARAVSPGGESGHADSRHFTDQAERYASGNLREVYFYPSQLAGHTEREYHPGQ